MYGVQATVWTDRKGKQKRLLFLSEDGARGCVVELKSDRDRLLVRLNKNYEVFKETLELWVSAPTATVHEINKSMELQ